MPLTRYNPARWTWGCELELGDVARNIAIPKRLGSWEYAETDIVNRRPPYKNVAADPLGEEPPVGGEINVAPTTTIDEQLQHIKSLIRLFGEHGCEPTVSQCVMEFHVHVHIPGLTEDIGALKRITKYIAINQKTVVDKCVAYREHPLMRKTKTARTYLKWDMGRMMPYWMADNIIEKAGSFEDFIRIQCCGKDGVSMGRPFRYTVNTYCLKHIKTIEFRCFRASLDLDLLCNCFCFVRDFMASALGTQKTAASIIEENNYKFPPFVYDHEQYLGWEQTKWGKERGKKRRQYIPVT
jgi:hypothetical protein